MCSSKNVGVAFAGLLVVAAISVAAGSGRKPAKEQQAGVSLRRLSSSEVMGILGRFPEMIPSYLAPQKDDRELLARLFTFSELTAAPLKCAFPEVRFYQGRDGKKPPHPYLMAVAGDKRYVMTDEFNRLLVDNGQKVTDKNIVELAEAFVVLAMSGEKCSIPEIAFLGATSTKQPMVEESYDVRLKVKAGERTEEWYLRAMYGQVAVVYRSNTKGLINHYLPAPVEPPPGRGQLEAIPDLTIKTSPVGDAYVEPPFATHYYLTVERNSSPTGDTVVFSLNDFSPSMPNVYVEVKDTIRAGAIRHFQNVTIDTAGCGSDTWAPPVGSTGIYLVTAGYVWGGTYYPWLIGDTSPISADPVLPVRYNNWGHDTPGLRAVKNAVVAG